MNWKEQVAHELVAPVIVKLLKPISASDFSAAIIENFDLAAELRKDTEYLRTLSLLVATVPYKDRLARYLAAPRWIDWFIANELKHKRPDLNLVVEFNPKAREYFHVQLRKIVKLLF